LFSSQRKLVLQNRLSRDLGLSRLFVAWVGADGGEREMFIFWWILVGLIAGFITGKIMKGSGYGPLMDIVIGILGAVIGGVLMRTLGFAGEGGLIYTIIVAILGAVILTLLVRLITGNRGRNL
jgi:uncharacterized membrane protein YeaQ/YmgE (transglycosylase-associated protein family)